MADVEARKAAAKARLAHSKSSSPRPSYEETSPMVSERRPPSPVRVEAPEPDPYANETRDEKMLRL